MPDVLCGFCGKLVRMFGSHGCPEDLLSFGEARESVKYATFPLIGWTALDDAAFAEWCGE